MVAQTAENKVKNARIVSKSTFKNSGLSTLVAALIGTIPFVANAIEEPTFSVVQSHETWEVRQYAPSIEARVTVEAPWDDAVSAGFRVLAGYIFGGNQPSVSIDMTAPVAAQRDSSGQDIAMTAPVAAQQADGNAEQWTVAFTMPSKWTLDTLPTPNDPSINLVQVAPRQVAALSFGMWATESRVAEKTAELKAALNAAGLKTSGQPVVAQYSPPWTPPPFRTNEIQWLLQEGNNQ